MEFKRELVAITDIFKNNKFNMMLVTNLSIREINLRIYLIELMKINKFKMDKNQLIEVKKSKREIKEELQYMERRRHKLMQEESVQFQLFGLISNFNK